MQRGPNNITVDSFYEFALSYGDTPNSAQIESASEVDSFYEFALTYGETPNSAQMQLASTIESFYEFALNYGEISNSESIQPGLSDDPLYNHALIFGDMAKPTTARTLPIESASEVDSLYEFALTYGETPNSEQIQTGTSKKSY